MKVYAHNETYECKKATKGPDYIILDDGMGAAFYGISDFNGYVLEGGEWSEPEDTETKRMQAQIDALTIALLEG